MTHRNPALLAASPHAFRPERWTNGETDADCRGAPISRSAAAIGICIGEAFAWTEGVLLLAGLARRHRFVLSGDAERRSPLDPSVTLRPGRPVMLRVEARASTRLGVP